MTHHVRGNLNKVTADLLPETIEPEGSGITYSKCEKQKTIDQVFYIQKTIFQK